jgi:hypothetical protein
MSEENERITLTVDHAISLLEVDDGRVHTFRQGGFTLIGADWDLDDVREFFAAHTPELAGEQATKMRHGVVAIDDNGPVFFATAAE